jgi:hypothetical protein
VSIALLAGQLANRPTGSLARKDRRRAALELIEVFILDSSFWSGQLTGWPVGRWQAG